MVRAVKEAMGNQIAATMNGQKGNVTGLYRMTGVMDCFYSTAVIA